MNRKRSLSKMVDKMNDQQVQMSVHLSDPQEDAEMEDKQAVMQNQASGTELSEENQGGLMVSTSQEILEQLTMSKK